MFKFVLLLVTLLSFPAQAWETESEYLNQIQRKSDSFIIGKEINGCKIFDFYYDTKNNRYLAICEKEKQIYRIDYYVGLLFDCSESRIVCKEFDDELGKLISKEVENEGRL